MCKNYYLVLGVADNATLEEIKAAFRRRAREVHPDHSGQESDPFLEVQEAYGVLSDPERRHHYDQGQHHRRPALRRHPWGPPPEPLFSRARPAAEPLRPVQPSPAFRDISLADTFARHAPTFDELFDRLWRNFAGVDRPKAEQMESLTLEVVLEPEEALQGGRVQVGIPARATCPACGGHGAVGRYMCWRCEGHGALTAEYPVAVDYPAGTRNGYAVQIPLAHYGIENLYLTVLFRV